MEFSVKSGHPEKQRTACVVVGVFESRKPSAAANQMDKASDGYLSSLIRRGDMEGKLGQTLLLPQIPKLLCDRVLLVGCGKERDFDDKAFAKVIRTTADRLNESGATEATVYLTDLTVRGRDTEWKIRQTVTVIRDSLYRFDQLKSKKEETRRPLKKTILSVPSRRDLPLAERALEVGLALSDGIDLAKDLGNLPGNYCTPTYLSDEAKKIGKKYSSIKTTVLNEADMEKLGMGSFLSVSRGSEQEAKLITMQYSGGKKDQKPIVLVGKGITFDTGGISLKPGATMDEMKWDMCGAASVFGVMKTLAEAKLPINVVGVAACAENMPSGRATKPGDVVTSMSGQTIEVLNTDAEGRLVLCDALTYVSKFDPDVVVDIATLTGACIVALGNQCSAVLGNHSPLVNDLIAAGKSSGDRTWELPLWDEYAEGLKSNFADMANISSGGGAGTITAACFLSKFTKKYRWAHLDIAGIAWKQGKEKGSTGRPVPMLVQYLLDRIAEGSA